MYIYLDKSQVSKTPTPILFCIAASRQLDYSFIRFAPYEKQRDGPGAQDAYYWLARDSSLHLEPLGR